jgi:hypothetical protein
MHTVFFEASPFAKWKGELAQTLYIDTKIRIKRELKMFLSQNYRIYVS